MLKTIFYNNEEKSVVILDQNQLPERIAYESCSDHFQVAAAIKKLKVRGAPLIGVSAAFGLALALKNYSGPRENLAEYYYKARRAVCLYSPHRHKSVPDPAKDATDLGRK